MMKSKIVRYNGRMTSYAECADAKQLVKGKLYKVIDEKEMDWQTNYKLNGVEGWFNSVWFDEIKAYLAVTNETPKAGETCDCMRIEFCNGIPDLKCCRTGKIKVVEPMGNDTYCVWTNNIYIMQVG